jgi:sugar O-acyltransferase (sialic acid O-acetyltransferase NeuD family)
MSDKVVIFGTGGFAEVVHYYLDNDKNYEVAAFTASASHIDEKQKLELPIVPFESLEEQYPPPEYKLFIAIGYKNMNQVRSATFQEAKSRGYDCISYVSPDCTNRSASIGENCFIFEDNTLQPFVEVGDNVVMWSGNHIGHHSKIGAHCFITSHTVISGYVHVGSHCFIGVNATLRDSISIGNSCLIGAGALIMKSTENDEVYIAPRTKPDSRKSHELGL